jgi:hypothetical protein
MVSNLLPTFLFRLRQATGKTRQKAGLRSVFDTLIVRNGAAASAAWWARPPTAPQAVRSQWLRRELQDAWKEFQGEELPAVA